MLEKVLVGAITPNVEYPKKKILALVLSAIASINASAFEIDTESDVKVRWDTTLKYSAAWRMQDPSAKLIANPNLDDGDRNFKKGLISNRADWLTELDISKNNFGGRISAAGWYDDVYRNHTDNDSPGTRNSIFNAPNDFPSGTRSIAGNYSEILDAFIFGKISGESTETTLRIGRHALIWGETLFMGRNGIAGGMAPVDAIKALAVPGSQFKEIVRPVNQFSMQSQLNSNISIGAYYQFEFEPTRIPPSGSYFSSTGDMMGRGGQSVLMIPQMGPIGPYYFANEKDMRARDSGQGGMQVRFRLDGGNTDYGLYLIRYHDKDPSTFYMKPTLPSAAWLACVKGINPALCGMFAPSMLPFTNEMGTYQQVYAEAITAFGTSFSTTLGSANVAGEISLRNNAPLVNDSQLVMPGQSANNSDNPLYPVGKTAHVNLSLIDVLDKNVLWNTANITAELAWNRRLSISKNPDQLDPHSTRDAMSLRVLFEPTYYQVFENFDLTVPINVSYSPYGRSSAVSNFGVERGGDFSVGLRGDYMKVWKLSLNYTKFYGTEKAYTDANNIQTFGQSMKDRDFLSFSVSRTF